MLQIKHSLSLIDALERFEGIYGGPYGHLGLGLWSGGGFMTSSLNCRQPDR